jgi:hypothetical protein
MCPEHQLEGDQEVKDFKQIVLGQFETDVAMALIEFGKFINTIDADVLIFMARKSLCIYDVLLRLGLPPAEQYVVSDRILDLRLDQLIGKRVALIDDTLIVGTALAKTRQFLIEAGVTFVQVHVFCADDKWWSKDLIQPDSVALHLSDQRVMTFCTAAVRAMSLVPRPYLVDFPLSRPMKIPAREAQCFLSNIEWRGYNISTHLQRSADVSALSFFPNAETQDQIEALIGEQVFSLLDIVKIRGFARKLRDVYWLQIVPIAVLKPLDTKDLERTLHYCLEGVGKLGVGDRERLLHHAHTPRAQQRLLQYLISCIVGHYFVKRAQLSLGRALRFSFDMQETDRHFGPWLHDSMRAITGCEMLSPAKTNQSVDSTTTFRVTPAPLPSKVQNWALSSLPTVDQRVPNSFQLFRESEIANLIPDFSGIFLSHYATRELPARNDALKRGKDVLISSDVLSNRNRLEMGLPWSTIVSYLSSLHGLNTTPEIEQAFSLALDFCNDQGIAVAITCLVDQVAFRAYRHGEDVRFTEAEVALAFEALSGFMKAANVDTISRLKLEKLLVMLVKVGVAKNFLEPLLIATGGVQEVLRIGFYLRGAVPILARGPRDRADRENWFSKYLVTRGVIRVGPKGTYQLGESVEGNFRVSSAPDEAYELGHMIGRLSQAKKDPDRRDAPLDDNAITLLASCGTPRHAAASIQVELDLFRGWFRDIGRAMFRKLDWSSVPTVKTALQKLIVSNAHVAVHGTRLKYVGYKINAAERVITECADYLAKSADDLPRRKWLGYWNAARILESTGEKVVFDPMIDDAARIAWEAGLYFSLIEISLATYLVAHSPKVEANNYLQTALRKFGEYSESMESTGLTGPANAARVKQTVELLASTSGDDSKVIFALNEAVREISALLPGMAGQSESMSPQIEEYGRLAGRRDYQYMVYYDIIDSTATTAGRSGIDVDAFRRKVSGLKELLNSGFRRLSHEAQRAASEVFCWNGGRDSTNDCKHVFIGGPSATALLNEVLHHLTASLEAFGTLRLRIYVIPCNFAGSSTYRMEWDTEVSGDRFWEHWSRLQRGAKEFEEASGKVNSFLLVAVEDVIERITISANWLWESPRIAVVASEIELLVKSTTVKFGVLLRRARLSSARN